MPPRFELILITGLKSNKSLAALIALEAMCFESRVVRPFKFGSLIELNQVSYRALFYYIISHSTD